MRTAQITYGVYHSARWQVLVTLGYVTMTVTNGIATMLKQEN